MPALKFYLRDPVDPPRIPQDGWRSRAACAGHPSLPAWTWDDHVSPTDVREDVETRARRVAQAQAVCRGCSVRLECLAAVDTSLDDGIRGGVDLRAARAEQAS